jgi:hypothetical protein
VRIRLGIRARVPGPAADTAGAVRPLAAAATVRVDRPAVEAGLAVLEADGDFADGVIAFDGRRLGSSVFASIDRAHRCCGFDWLAHFRQSPPRGEHFQPAYHAGQSRYQRRKWIPAFAGMSRKKNYT